MHAPRGFASHGRAGPTGRSGDTRVFSITDQKKSRHHTKMPLGSHLSDKVRTLVTTNTTEEAAPHSPRGVQGDTVVDGSS